MIVERAIAEHVASLSDGLHVFRDELAWTQAGEPWPCLLVTLVSLQTGSKGTGLYDHRTFNAATNEYTYGKVHVEQYLLRLTIRAVANGAKPGSVLVADVVEVVKALVRRHSRGQSLDLVDTVTQQSVHIERLRLVTVADNGAILSHVPFEAQQTVDIEVVVNWPETTATAKPFADVDMHVELE